MSHKQTQIGTLSSFEGRALSRADQEPAKGPRHICLISRCVFLR